MEMIGKNHLLRMGISLWAIAAFFLLAPLPQQAKDISPVRLSITAASGSGIEQELVDYISGQFDKDANVVLSTINPDWYVLCTINDKQDSPAGQIRFNGTVLVKTTDGQVVSTSSAQKYNQDFSLQNNAPLNKQLVDSAAREVINGLGSRSVAKIKEAVQAELQARDQIAQAESLAKDDKYDQAISILEGLGANTVHYRENQKRITQFQMEKHAMELVSNAQSKAKSGRYSEAISLLKEVNLQSKRHQLALQLSRRYRALLASSHRQSTNNSSKTKEN